MARVWRVVRIALLVFVAIWFALPPVYAAGWQTAVVGCDAMTWKEKLFGSVAAGAWLYVGASYVWPIAGPDYSDANKARIFLIWFASGIAVVLWLMCEIRGRRMSFFEFVLWGGGLGVFAGFVTWGIYALGEKSPTVAQAVGAKSPPTDKALGPPPSQDTTQSEDLDFYFHSFFFGGGEKDIQYGDLTVTNRSPRKMHLQLWGHIFYWKDNGEPASLEMPAEWSDEEAVTLNPDGLKENTGQDFIDFDEWETKNGRVVLILPKPDTYGIRAWRVDASRDVYFHGFESVTGKHIAFKAVSGYPTDKVPWPFPSPMEALALDFPEASVPKDLPALEPLDLLIRTLGHMYNDEGVVVPAVISNNSANRMKLQITLLTRKSRDEKEWRAFHGLFKPSAEKNPSDFYALDFRPGDIADCSLIFANTGLTNEEGHELKESPSLSLLEIYDEVSGRRVWCAIKPGYPPGTDMRSFTIQRPSEKPWANSNNPPADESKDTK